MSDRPGRRLALGRIAVGDARPLIDRLPDASVDTVVTSPPYFRLRNYRVDGQIGLEETVDEWVGELRLVARGLHRVVAPHGSLWMNLGDTFARSASEGGHAKGLLLAPERLAIALSADGWILRNKVIWAKTNPMPTSIGDRLSCGWETVYFFVKQPQYFFDLDAIRVAHRSLARPRQSPAGWSVPTAWRGPGAGSNGGLDRLHAAGQPGHALGKNPGDVWVLPTANYRGSHHAVFPEALVERPLRAASPELVCTACNTPWRRLPAANRPGIRRGGLRKSCACASRATRPGVVLDPFIGAGTTAVVAERLQRDWIGIELNPAMAVEAQARISAAR